MHRSKALRVVPLALVLLALALPAAAQPAKEPGANLGRLVSALWERLSSPLASLWEKGRGIIDPDGVTAPDTTSTTPPPPPTPGRGVIDPDG
jgi:hypothetical protein